MHGKKRGRDVTWKATMCLTPLPMPKVWFSPPQTTQWEVQEELEADLVQEHLRQCLAQTAPAPHLPEDLVAHSCSLMSVISKYAQYVICTEMNVYCAQTKHYTWQKVHQPPVRGYMEYLVQVKSSDLAHPGRRHILDPGLPILCSPHHSVRNDAHTT